ncbi:DUF4263 domain-containing protein [Nocardia iowensis]|uniref:DUF4263 domain-containing protein n=1 Tax=Nocardia iowensis TaxID=204891 RepID=A0ABX8RZ58_NOCIO|nr:DUF4263 domain-containing protein [Nocardia iowensis]
MDPEHDSWPQAMGWDEYADIVGLEWQSILNATDCAEETIHKFLEDHPCLVPGHDAFRGANWINGEPGPIREALFTKPRIGSGRSGYYIPDFMWLPTDSQTQWVVLIEIESPAKPWFTQSGQQTAKYTQARGQIEDWKAHFQDPRNKSEFIRKHVGAFRPLEFVWCLIYGRRQDAMRSSRGSARRAAGVTGDVIAMSFDRLRPLESARNSICVKGEEGNFVAVSIPPTVRINADLAKMWGSVLRKDEAVLRSPHFSADRRAFLVERFRWWDEQVRAGTAGFSLEYE